MSNITEIFYSILSIFLMSSYNKLVKKRDYNFHLTKKIESLKNGVDCSKSHSCQEALDCSCPSSMTFSYLHIDYLEYSYYLNQIFISCMRKLGHKTISPRSHSRIKETPGLQSLGLHTIWFTYSIRFKHLESIPTPLGLKGSQGPLQQCDFAQFPLLTMGTMKTSKSR